MRYDKLAEKVNKSVADNGYKGKAEMKSIGDDRYTLTVMAGERIGFEIIGTQSNYAIFGTQRTEKDRTITTIEKKLYDGTHGVKLGLTLGIRLLTEKTLTPNGYKTKEKATELSSDLLDLNRAIDYLTKLNGTNVGKMLEFLVESKNGNGMHSILRLRDFIALMTEDAALMKSRVVNLGVSNVLTGEGDVIYAGQSDKRD